VPLEMVAGAWMACSTEPSACPCLPMLMGCNLPVVLVGAVTQVQLDTLLLVDWSHLPPFQCTYRNRVATLTNPFGSIKGIAINVSLVSVIVGSATANFRAPQVLNGTQ